MSRPLVINKQPILRVRKFDRNPIITSINTINIPLDKVLILFSLMYNSREGDKIPPYFHNHTTCKQFIHMNGVRALGKVSVSLGRKVRGLPYEKEHCGYLLKVEHKIWFRWWGLEGYHYLPTPNLMHLHRECVWLDRIGYYCEVELYPT